jgi:uncharacterized UBP type Zn finger protein
VYKAVSNLVVKLPLPEDSEPDCEPDTIEIPPVSTLFNTLVSQMTRAGDSDAISPQDFKDNICHYQAFDAFNNHQQQDAHEFFLKLEESLVREMKDDSHKSFQGNFYESVFIFRGLHVSNKMCQVPKLHRQARKIHEFEHSNSTHPEPRLESMPCCVYNNCFDG